MSAAVRQYAAPPLRTGRLSASVRRAVRRCGGLATPVWHGGRWVPVALAIGALPFLGSYTVGLPGHQAVSALALTFLCLPCVCDDAWGRGLSAILLAFGAHCAVVIALAHGDPQGVTPLVPDAGTYWHK